MKSEKENTASSTGNENTTFIVDSNVGEVSQSSDTYQKIERVPVSIPADDPLGHNNRIDFIQTILKATGLTTGQLDSISGVSFVGSLVGLYLSLSSMSLTTTSVLVQVNIPQTEWVLVFSSLLMAVTVAYFGTRRWSHCPECDASLALRTVETEEYPNVGEDSRNGVNLLECEECGHEEQRRWNV